MSKSKDSWCVPLHRKNKPTLYGGAARNVRISKSGGMDTIIESVVVDAFKKADLLASESINMDFSSSKKKGYESSQSLH